MEHPVLQESIATDAADQVAKALEAILSKEWDPTKAPPSFDVALNGVREADTTQLRELLSATPHVWFAYLLAVTHDSEFEATVANLTLPEIRHVTAKITPIVPHNSILQLYQHLFVSSKRARTRCRTVDQMQSAQDYLQPRKRLRASPCDRPRELSSPRLCTNTSLAHTSPSDHETNQNNNDNNNSDHNNKSNNWRHGPKALYLPGVFPNYLCKTIVKDGYSAAVSAYFAPVPNECYLALRLSATQIPYIAQELFGIHIDVQENRRYLLVDPGVQIKIGGAISFFGASISSIMKLFGTTVNQSLRTSSKFIEEMNLGEDRTNCLSMRVEGDASYPSDIKLFLDAEKLMTIVELLWPM
ncbi:hypothetical protein F5Y13DRAFT_102191 [Hypoxylon sp. FL1857]|nr:hypothetical protein F5Y13DRAFT_102191 [Hypoxylon sp. FL1857]